MVGVFEELVVCRGASTWEDTELVGGLGDVVWREVGEVGGDFIWGFEEI